LPPEHDPLWDQLRALFDSYTLAVLRGSSVGLSFHLAIDGAVQPAAYKDLPLSAPIEVHQALLLGNSAAEALDAFHKTTDQAISTGRAAFRRAVSGVRSLVDTSLHSAGMSGPALGQLAASGAFGPELFRIYLDHIILLALPYQVPAERAATLSASERAKLEKYGRWMDAIASGHICVLTMAQLRFFHCARGLLDPTTEHERLWRRLHERERSRA
jgi:hypothetical protein